MSGPTTEGQDQGDELWLAQGRAVEDGSLEAAVVGNADVRIVRHIARDIMLLQMGQAQADQLQATFAGDLLIERDMPVPQPRQPFGL